MPLPETAILPSHTTMIRTPASPSGGIAYVTAASSSGIRCAHKLYPTAATACTISSAGRRLARDSPAHLPTTAADVNRMAVYRCSFPRPVARVIQRIVAPHLPSAYAHTRPERYRRHCSAHHTPYFDVNIAFSPPIKSPGNSRRVGRLHQALPLALIAAANSIKSTSMTSGPLKSMTAARSHVVYQRQLRSMTFLQAPRLG